MMIMCSIEYNPEFFVWDANKVYWLFSSIK